MPRGESDKWQDDDRALQLPPGAARRAPPNRGGGGEREWWERDAGGGHRDDFRGGRDDFRGGRDGFRGGRDDFRGGRDDFRGGRDDFRSGRDDFRGGRGDFRGGQEEFSRREGNGDFDPGFPSFPPEGRRDRQDVRAGNERPATPERLGNVRDERGHGGRTGPARPAEGWGISEADGRWLLQQDPENFTRCPDSDWRPIGQTHSTFGEIWPDGLPYVRGLYRPPPNRWDGHGSLPDGTMLAACDPRGLPRGWDRGNRPPGRDLGFADVVFGDDVGLGWLPVHRVPGVDPPLDPRGPLGRGSGGARGSLGRSPPRDFGTHFDVRRGSGGGDGGGGGGRAAAATTTMAASTPPPRPERTPRALRAGVALRGGSARRRGLPSRRSWTL